jgi:imidazolonepropionase-like amidohydrolase
VHFTEPKWANPRGQPAARLTAHLQQMLTQYGFTTAVDLASNVVDTVALRQRIEQGEVIGPRILTAGLPLYPTNGVPYYVSEALPEEIVKQLPTPATPGEAVEWIRRNIAAGADLLKLFLVTGVRQDGQIVLKSMAPAIATAAVAEAHRHGQRVFAHPSTVHGLNVAIASGVDGLAHTIQDTENWNETVVQRLREADVALVPTLTLFQSMSDFDAVLKQVKSYVDAGGRVLYGTDIGFLPNYAALQREIEWLAQSGLSFSQILATLTTVPAAEFGMAGRSGVIAPGAEADFVLLAADPAKDVRALSDVVQTWRAGRQIYARSLE